jgi:hypothetical protein
VATGWAFTAVDDSSDLQDVAVGDDGLIVAVGAASVGPLIVSSRDGRSWTRASLAGTELDGGLEWVTHDSDGVFLAGSARGLWRSDGGSSWERVPDPHPSDGAAGWDASIWSGDQFVAHLGFGAWGGADR